MGVGRGDERRAVPQLAVGGSHGVAPGARAVSDHDATVGKDGEPGLALSWCADHSATSTVLHPDQLNLGQAVAKDNKSEFPGSLRDHKDAANAEGDKVSAKIDDAFKKLSKKMRDHADKAKTKMEGTKKPEKRAVLLRHFELYNDAAIHLEEKLALGSD